MTAKKTGHSAKHTSSRKHAGTSKHEAHVKHLAHEAHEKHLAHLKAIGKAPKVTAKAKHPTHAKARGLAVGDLLPVCAFEAIAMSLRLAGRRVADDDVAGLWELCGAPGVGVPIGQALAAAALFGLAECSPVAYDLNARDVSCAFEIFGVDDHHAAVPGALAVEAQALPPVQLESVLHRAVHQAVDGRGHALILGIDVPGPHCVLATPGGWWSWGELRDPWPARIEEAWLVRWTDERPALGAEPPFIPPEGRARAHPGLSLAGDAR